MRSLRIPISNFQPARVSALLSRAGRLALLHHLRHDPLHGLQRLAQLRRILAARLPLTSITPIRPIARLNRRSHTVGAVESQTPEPASTLR